MKKSAVPGFWNPVKFCLRRTLVLPERYATRILFHADVAEKQGSQRITV